MSDQATFWRVQIKLHQSSANILKVEKDNGSRMGQSLLSLYYIICRIVFFICSINMLEIREM